MATQQLDSGPAVPTTRRNARTGATGGMLGSRFRRGVVGVAVFFVLAEGFTRLEIVDAQYLPYASTILRRVVELLSTASFLTEVGWTLLAWLLAFLIATIVGVVLGVLLAESRVTAAIGSVSVSVLRPMPAVVFVPLASLVWGQGLTTKLILVSFSAVWPVLFNTIAGVRDADPVAIDTVRSFRRGRLGVLREVVMPGAVPQIFTGMRVAASVAMVAIVGVELIAGATHGIGAFIIKASASGTDIASVMAGAVVAGILGTAVNQAFLAIDRRWLAWARREVSA